MASDANFGDISDEELARLVNPDDPQSELEAIRAIGEEELGEERRLAGEERASR